MLARSATLIYVVLTFVLVHGFHFLCDLEQVVFARKDERPPQNAMLLLQRVDHAGDAGAHLTQSRQICFLLLFYGLALGWLYLLLD